MSRQSVSTTVSTLKKKCGGCYVGGLATYASAGFCLSDVLAKHLDVPHKMVVQVAEAYDPVKLPGIEMPKGQTLVNRALIEQHLFQAKQIGPKWGAVAYGITDESLRLLLIKISEGNTGKKAGSLAYILIQQWDEEATIDQDILRHVIDDFCWKDDSTIYGSMMDRSEHIVELAKKGFGIDLTLAPEANLLWLQAKNSRVELVRNVASTFCAFTGLPIAHSMAEYLSFPKPGVLQPDYISWLALAEDKKLREWTVQHDYAEFSSFVAKAGTNGEKRPS